MELGTFCTDVPLCSLVNKVTKVPGVRLWLTKEVNVGNNVPKVAQGS